MNHIVMLLSNPFRPDPRVLKEASSLAEIGYVVTILCWDRTALLPEKEILSSGVKIHRIHNVRSSYGIGARQITHLIAFWRQLLTWLDDLQPDFVHCHDFDTLPAGLWWRRRNNAPIIYDAHEHYAELIKPRLQGSIGKLFYRVIRWAEYRSAQKADAVITVDEILAHRYQKYNSRILIIGHYPPRHMAQQPSQAFQHDQLRMIYAGRLSIDRGLLLYPDIQARGDAQRGTTYWAGQRRMVVTELLQAGQTMAMNFVPDRPGGGIFHCHLSFHTLMNNGVGPDTIPSAEFFKMLMGEHGDHDPDNHVENAMGGLIMAFYVRPTSTALSAGERRPVRLFITSDSSAERPDRRFSYLIQDAPKEPASDSVRSPGSTLILHRGEPTSVWVINRCWYCSSTQQACSSRFRCDTVFSSA